MKNSFFLVIPEQKNDPELQVSFEENSLNQWLHELPSANPSLSTRLFHDLLIEMNALVLDAENRLSALEQLRPQFLIIEDYLRSRLIKTGFPKSSNERKIMNVLVSIEKQYAIGYWIIVRELTRREISWFKGKNVALAIQRTIRGLSNIIITYYMFNSVVPDWIWIDLHSLYKLSVKIKKESSKVNDETFLQGKSCSPEDSYKQILLFSLTNPAGLMQKEFQSIFIFIEKLIPYLRISEQEVDFISPQCVILMDEDVAPDFVENGGKQDESACYLDLSKLYKACQLPEKYCSDTLPRYSLMEVEKDKKYKLSSELFNYLLARWQGQLLHGSLLFSDRLDRYIAIGLEPTYYLQNNVNSSTMDELEIAAESSSKTSLSCTFETDGALSIGSLVSVRKTDQPKNQRLLGVINKITLPKQENRLDFEISVITPVSYAVNFHPLDAAPDVEHQKALLYARKVSEGEKSYIIMDSFMYKEGDILRMYLNQDNFPIIIRDRKNIGLGYWQFECRRLAEKSISEHKTSPQNKQRNKKGYDFI